MQRPSTMRIATRKVILALVSVATLVPVVLAAGRIIPSGFGGTLAGAPVTQWMLFAMFVLLIVVAFLAADMD